MASSAGVWLMVLATALTVGIVFLIPVLLELRRAVRTLNGVLKITEESLAPTLRELRSTLQNLDRISSDVSTVTDDLRVFSGSIRQVGRDVQELSGLISAVGGGIGPKIAGLRAGITTGVAYFAKNLLKRKGGHP